MDICYTLLCWLCCIFVLILHIYTCYLLLCPGRGAEYCDQFVCLSVCLSVCTRAYLWNRWTDLCEIFCADLLWPWLGPPLAALRYVMYFRFIDDVMWPYWAVWLCVGG